jgi:hypothetical protein
MMKRTAIISRVLVLFSMTAALGCSTLVRVVVTPHPHTVERGTDAQFSAIGTWSDGRHEDMTAQAIWKSTPDEVAAVTAPGVVRGKKIGSANITAQVRDRSGFAALSVTGRLEGFGVGPRGIVSDGAHVWVAYHGSNTVVKIRIESETPVSTISVPTPHALALEGSNLWVASTDGGVYKFDWSGSQVGSTVTGVGIPQAMAVSVGQGVAGGPRTYLWVTDHANGLHKIDAATNSKANYQTVCDARPATPVTAVAVDGNGRIWTTCDMGLTGYGYVNGYDSNGNPRKYGGWYGQSPQALAFDGNKNRMWVTTDYTAYTIDVNTNSVNLVSGGSGRSVAFSSDRQSIWVVTSKPPAVKHFTRDGDRIGTYSAGLKDPYGVAVGGVNIWVTDREASGLLRY